MLKDGRKCCLRNGTENDAQEVLDVFNLTHAETDYLLTYPDENSFTVEQEGAFLKAKTESSNEIEIIADVVSDNASAISLYKKVGFVEYGRNPKGFNSRISGYQELIYMKLDL